MKTKQPWFDRLTNLKTTGFVSFPLEDCFPDTDYLRSLADRRLGAHPNTSPWFFIHLLWTPNSVSPVSASNKQWHSSQELLHNFYLSNLPDSLNVELRDALQSNNILGLPATVYVLLCGHKATSSVNDETILTIVAASTFISSPNGAIHIASTESVQPYNNEFGTKKINKSFNEMGLIPFLFNLFARAHRKHHELPVTIATFPMYAQVGLNNPFFRQLLGFGFQLSPVVPSSIFHFIPYNEIKVRNTTTSWAKDIDGKTVCVWFPGQPLVHCNGKLHSILYHLHFHLEKVFSCDFNFLVTKTMWKEASPTDPGSLFSNTTDHLFPANVANKADSFIPNARKCRCSSSKFTEYTHSLLCIECGHWSVAQWLCLHSFGDPTGRVHHICWATSTTATTVENSNLRKHRRDDQRQRKSPQKGIISPQ